MNILELQNIFRSELGNIFPKNEIDSFFYMLSDTYLHLKKVDIALNPNLTIAPSIEKEFNSALDKLKKEEPIQYILGETEFYGLPFYIDKNVLIPRPETEELVKWIIDEIKSQKSKIKSYSENNLKIFDIGTGSGCIAISLAKHLPNAKILALDVSDKALDIAKKNATLNNAEIHFLTQNILTTKQLPEIMDIIVSNPPYVRELEKYEINNNVLKHEPHLALFVEDENALIFYDKIADLAKENLNNKGQLYFEINQYLAKETTALLKNKGFKNIELRKDIFGNSRMLKAEI